MTAFHVPGIPVPKARPRVVNGHTYTPQRTKDYETLVGMCYSGQLYEEQVRIQLTFHLSNRRRVDIDNLIKAVLDGLNGHAYHDDGQVVEIFARKRLGCDTPGVWGVVRGV